MTENNVPRLRFREFDGEWKCERLSKNISLLNGLTYSPKDVNSDGTFVIRSSNVKDDNLIDDDNVYVNPQVVNTENVKQGDIVVVVRNGSRALIGKHAIVNQNMTNTVVGAFMTLIRTENGRFYNALLSTDLFKKEVHKALGATINQITKKDFGLMDFFFPNYDEEQRIGLFFSKIDKFIELQTQKLEKLKKLKRGYIQKMFPQDGESVPRLRFNGFSGEWGNQGLLDLAKLRTGSRNAEDGVDDGKFVFFDRSSEIKFLNEYDFDGEVIVYAGEGSKFLPRKFNGKYSLHQRAYGIYDFKNINFEFLYQELLNKNNHFLKYAVGTTAKSLRKDCFEKLIIKYPSVDEQQRIGSFLSKIDQMINNQSDIIDELKQQKKAYLQKMFK